MPGQTIIYPFVMITYVQGLLAKLDAGIGDIRMETGTSLYYTQCLKLTSGSIRDLKKYIRTHPFKSLSAEIQYYKFEAPDFYGKHFFYERALKLEQHATISDRKELSSYIKKELKAMRAFYRENADYVQYQQVGDSFMDDKRFVSDLPEMQIITNAAITLGDDICWASLVAARMLAYARYKPLLQRQMDLIKHPESAGVGGGQTKIYGFRGTLADAIEIIDCWGRLEVITVNGRTGTQKEITEMWEGLFGMKLGNVSGRKRVNHARKKEKTPFLKKMVKALEEEDSHQNDGQNPRV
jgi:RteC protein